MNRPTHAFRTDQRWGDDQQVSDLVTAHLPLVKRIAWHVHGRAPGAIELEELEFLLHHKVLQKFSKTLYQYKITYFCVPQLTIGHSNF